MTDLRESPFEVIAKYQRELPVDVNGLGTTLGLTITYMPLGPDISGTIMRDRRRGGPSGFAIFVNSFEHPNRQRFTAAHEISHFILHRDLIETGVIDDTMYRSKELNSWQEVEANRLAADILMPIMVVKSQWKANQNVDELARRFGVSKQAMEIRVKGLRV